MIDTIVVITIILRIIFFIILVALALKIIQKLKL